MQNIVDISGRLNGTKERELDLQRKIAQLGKIVLAMKAVADQTDIVARKANVVAARAAEANRALLGAMPSDTA